MSEVRVKGKYEQWVKFFLRAVGESAQDVIITINELDKLHEENYAKIQTLGRARINATKLFEYLEENPIIDISKTAVALDLSYNTVSLAVKNLTSLNILNKTESKTYSYTAYLDVLKKGT